MNRYVVNWFEIPVQDMARAKKFYTSVFKKELTDYPKPGVEMAIFPYVDHNTPGACGALIKMQGAQPSLTGTIVYFSCEDLSQELTQAEKSGGKTLVPKMAIGENGFIAHIQDTEGNRIGLHSMK